MALAALEAGDRVVATARNADDLAGLASTHPETCHAMEIDTTVLSELPTKVQEAQAVFGRIDVLVNNAGRGLIGALEECSDADIDGNVAVNLMGPLHLMRAVLPIMRGQGSGHIVNMSAAAAISNYPGFSIYGAAKAALEFASEAVKAEAGPLGVKVTLVEPGPFRTDFIGRSMAKGSQPVDAYAGTSGRFAKLLEGMNGKQVGDPAKAAAVIVNMVSEGKAPLRLPLGKYAVKKIKDRAAASVRETEAWEAVVSATDF
jgi:NAD(P)-dependent dehydrogenase (short-subunit alcohol dehydrogenase family)